MLRVVVITMYMAFQQMKQLKLLMMTIKMTFWFALAQAITKDDYESLTQLCLDYCALWTEFWDAQIADVQFIEEKKLA